MCEKLWFISQNDFLVDVYDKEDTAVEMKLSLSEDNPKDNFFVHSINFAKLARFSDEFDFARDRGYLHD